MSPATGQEMKLSTIYTHLTMMVGRITPHSQTKERHKRVKNENKKVSD